MPKDYYETLGVPRDAAPEDIKRAYRRLSKENHPDLHPDDAEKEERFKEVGEAYAVLSDPEQRKRYDQGGATAVFGPDAMRDTARAVLDEMVFQQLRHSVPRRSEGQR